MADSNNQSFPKNCIEALAFLYVQNLDLSGLTPEQLFEKYSSAYDKISDCHDSEIGDAVKAGIDNFISR